MNPQPHPDFLKRGLVGAVPQWPRQNGVRFFMADGCSELVACPKGAPGDFLWVQEEHQILGHGCVGPSLTCKYLADGTARTVDVTPREYDLFRARKLPLATVRARFMYRSLARITLEVTAVRVERLKDISEADAAAEGYFFGPERCPDEFDPIGWYKDLWESINGPGAWDANPWVWCISFRRVRP